MHNNAHHLPPMGAAVPGAASGSVTAIVPARNEEAVIAPCIASLASQREIGEILVVNDQSTDGTASVVTNLLGKNLKLVPARSRRIARRLGWEEPCALGRGATGQVCLAPFHRCRRRTRAEFRVCGAPNCAGTHRCSGFIFSRADHRYVVREVPDSLCLLEAGEAFFVRPSE